MNPPDVDRLVSRLGARRVIDIGVRLGGGPLDLLALREGVQRVVESDVGRAAENDNVSPND